MPWYQTSILAAWAVFVVSCRLWWRMALEREILMRRAAPRADVDPSKADPIAAYRPLLRTMAKFAQTYLQRAEESLALALHRAGEPLGLSPVEWIGLRVTDAAGGLLLGMLVSWVGGGLVVPGVFFAAGFFCPEIWLRTKAASRQTELLGAVPAFLDTLATCLKAGVPLEAALERVARSLGGPLGAEWKRTMQAIRLHTPPAAAYRALAERVQSEDVEVLVQSLLQADAMGVAVADTLRQQARILRLRQKDRVRDQAAKAGPKISLITTMLTAPSVFLFILALTIISLASGGFGFESIF